MRRMHRLRIDHTLVATLVGAALWLASCSEKPAEPVFDNVFDPALGVDLLAPRVVFRNHAVVVTWNHLLADDLGEEAASYTLSRSIRADIGFEQVATLTERVVEGGDDDSPGTRTSVDVNYVPDGVNYYGVGFTTESGQKASAPGVPLITIMPPPRVRLQSAATKTAAPDVTLRLQSASSTLMHVSSSPTFETFTTVDDFTTAGGINDTLIPWDLGPASANGDTLWVYARSVREGGVFSATDTLALEVDFQPQLEWAEAMVFVPEVTLEVPIAGVSRMRFASSAPGLAAAEWIVPGSVSPQQVPFELSIEDDTPEVWAEYEGDFGFSAVVTTAVPTVKVSVPTLVLDGGAAVTTDRSVTVVSQVAQASLMRFSETPDFAGVAWVAFEDTTSVELSATPGNKTLYGWYANAFDTVGQAASAQIILVGEGAP